MGRSVVSDGATVEQHHDERKNGCIRCVQHFPRSTSSSNKWFPGLTKESAQVDSQMPEEPNSRPDDRILVLENDEEFD